MGGADVPRASAPRVLWGHIHNRLGSSVSNNTVTLFERLRLYARIDGNGGFLQSDTEIRALHNQGSTQAVIQRNDPFLQEYRAIEADAVGTYNAGFSPSPRAFRGVHALAAARAPWSVRTQRR